MLNVFHSSLLFLISVFLLSSSFFIFTAPGNASAQTECFAAGLSSQVVSGINKVLSVPTTNTTLELSQGAQTSKECLLDGIAVVVRETLIRKITTSIVTWINTGFEGSPAFVTNIDQYLLDTADEAFGSYIYENTNFAHLCSPFQFDVRFALALSYSTTAARPTCTLSDIVDNVETAIDDLSVEWDWEVYETITTDPSGNIFTAYIQEQENLSNFVNQTLGREEEDIERGDGFISFRVCEEEAAYGVSETLIGPPTAEEQSSGVTVTCETKTPGTIIKDALNNQIKLDTDRIAYADELNEIIGALMGQLAQQAFGRDGVSGLSQRSGNSESFISRYSQDATEASQSFAGQLASNASSAVSGTQYTEYIGVQNESIQTLLQAKIKVSEAFACYDSKYNTWLDDDGNVIAPSNIENVPDSERVRATFLGQFQDQDATRGTFVINFLTPTQSLEKSIEFKEIVDRIDADLLAAESNIESAREAAAQTASFQSRLSTTNNPAEIQGLYNDYIGSVGSVNVDTGLAQASLQNIISYTDQAINGSITFGIDGQVREGGATQELARCQTFNQAVDPQN